MSILFRDKNLGAEILFDVGILMSYVQNFEIAKICKQLVLSAYDVAILTSRAKSHDVQNDGPTRKRLGNVDESSER